MLSNQKSPRSSRVKGFAFLGILAALVMTFTAFGAGGSRLAFIDSAAEFLGLQSTITPVISNTMATNAVPATEYSAPVTVNAMGGISVSLPAVTSTPGNIVVDVTTGDLTGQNVLSYDLQVTF